MRIGVYLGDIKKPKSVGGLTFELSFVDELLKYDTTHEFVFYYFGEKNIFQDKENARFVCLKYYKKPAISLFPFCVRTYKTPICSLNYKLKKDSVDVVYFLSPYLHEHIEIPYFASIRNVSHRILPHFPEFSSNRVVEKMEKKFNIFLTSASKIITGNNVAKEDIKTLYDVIDENIITLNMPVPNWMESISEDETVLIKNGLSKNSFVLYPAQFWTYKNHVRLIQTAQILKEQNVNLKVVFTGQNRGNEKYIKNLVQELDLEEDVLFLDYISLNKLKALYQNALAVINPSLAGVDSICALEALYFNCPVLISNHLGYVQQLKKSALYFNPLDERDIFEKITSLDDLAIKDEIVSCGANLIKEYTFKNYIEKLLDMMDGFYLTRQCWSLGEDKENK